MRIVVAKPDFGVTGGFERVLDRVRWHLVAAGHEVQERTVRVAGLGRSPYGLEVPPHVWDRAPEYFRYLALVEAFRRLDVSGADVVLSTQPPSFAVDHPRVVALFYHHLRIYYDLSEPYVRAGFADPDLHAYAGEHVRAVDAPLLDAVRVFLAGSAEVAGRLERYNGRTSGVELFLAGADVEPVGDVEPPGAGPALCVSRSEWPKRTELFVQACHHLAARGGSDPGGVPQGVLVGDGGRLPFVRQLDARLAATGDPDAFDDAALWLNRGQPDAEPPGRPAGPVELAGRVDDRRLDRLYREAGCVVAPAYREDYGLTVLEAYARGRPVVVCRDGGGLTDLVDDGVTGLVVEPTGRAIADAVHRLRDDRALAKEMGEAGREALARYSWERALAVVDRALEASGAGGVT